MTEIPETKMPPMPDAIKWIIGFFVAVIFIWCLNAGTENTLSWLGWTVGPAILSTILFSLVLHAGERPARTGALPTLHEGFTVVAGVLALGFGLLAGFMLLVGVFGAAKMVLSPFFGSSYEDPDGPQNWRR